MLLLGVVVGVFALTGWRPGRAWIILGAGLAVTASRTSYPLPDHERDLRRGHLLDALWPASTLLVGFAAWQPASSPSACGSRVRVLLLPARSPSPGRAARAGTTFDAPTRRRSASRAATLLPCSSGWRLIFRETTDARASRREALTDPLTGLRNRRSADGGPRRAAAARRPRPNRRLVLFDLDGFKQYNDRFGHPAGDAPAGAPGPAPGRCGRARACLPAGRRRVLRAAEPGGRRSGPAAVAACVAALTEQRRGLRGHHLLRLGAELPRGRRRDRGAPASPTSACTAQGRRGARRRASDADVLLQALRARARAARTPATAPPSWPSAVGRELGIGPRSWTSSARAAELHDIGKVAIPDAILHKPGALDETEWALRCAGTRSSASASCAPPRRYAGRPAGALQPRALGRRGLPDGLAGEEIPLGARIIAVCDAYTR